MHKILIIDDQAYNRLLIASPLAASGVRVLEASNGREGLETARAEHPDLVLCDLVMPEMGGAEFVRELRRDPSVARTPVVFWTASYKEHEAARIAADCGVSRIVFKGQPAAEILDVMRVCLEESRHSSPKEDPVPAPAPLGCSPDTECRPPAVGDFEERLLGLLDLLESIRALDLQLGCHGGLQDLVRSARTLMGACCAGVAVLDVRPPLVAAAGIDPGSPELAAELEPGGLLGRLAAGRSLVRLPARAAAVPPSGTEMPLFPAGPFMAAPVATASHVYGLLWFCRPAAGAEFGPTDGRLALALGAGLATACETARLDADRREAEKKYRFLVEQLPAVTYVTAVGQTMDVLYVSPQIEALIGFSQAEWGGSNGPWPGRIHPRDRAEVSRRVASLDGVGDVFEAEYRLQHREGTWLWIRDEGRVIGLMPDGRPMVQGVFLDIGQRKRAELRLSMQHAVSLGLASAVGSNDGIRKTLEALMQGLGAVTSTYWSVAENGTELFVSEVCCRLADATSVHEGCKAVTFQKHQGLPGRVWGDGRPIWISDVTLDERCPRVRCARAAGLRSAIGVPVSSGQQSDGVFELFFGEELRVDSDLLDLLGTVGRTLGLFISQHRSEEALLERSQVAALAGEVSASIAQGGNLCQALQGCCEAVVRNLDAAFARIWTVDAAGQTLELQASAGLYTHLDGAHSRVKLGTFKIGRIAQERRPHLTNDVLTDEQVSDRAWAAREGMVSFAGHPLISDDRLVGVIALFARRPLTGTVQRALASIARSVAVGIERFRTRADLERSETQLRQAQKMEAFGQLAGGVAHDFNNLLTIISGHTHFIVEECSPDSPILEDAGVIATTAERAAALTRQLLAFSRKQLLNPQVLALNSHLEEFQKMLRRLIGEDIVVETRLAPDLAPVHVDAGQMDQVVLNLCVNARDAMPRGGRLIISTANVELGPADHREGLDPGRYVELTVADTGAGMDEETRLRVFEPFFTTKEKGKGTGLGLATVDGIARQSGGAVRVETVLGQGSRFSVLLPVATAAQLAKEGHHAATSAAHPRPAGRTTILVVDDDDSVRRFFRRALESEGYEVLEAAGGQCALDLCRSYLEPIQLAISDVVMPGLGGTEVATSLASLRPGIRLLLTSGYPDEALARYGVPESGIQFLAKPVTAVTLREKVREILNGG